MLSTVIKSEGYTNGTKIMLSTVIKSEGYTNGPVVTQ
jgi:hypothetical protein